MLKILKNKLNTLKFFLKPKKIIVLCRAFYGDEWMRLALHSVEDHVDKILIVTSSKTWNETDFKSDNIQQIFEELKTNLPAKYFLLEGTWNNQIQQQNEALDYIQKNHSDCTHLLFQDTDEVYTPEEIQKLVVFAKNWNSYNKGIRVRMHTYIKSIFYRVAPIEPYQPIVLLPIRDYVKFSGVRYTTDCNMIDSDVLMHHFSLVRRNDDRIKQKMQTRAKEYKRVENWYERFYENFSLDMKNFHPLKGDEEQWKSIEEVRPDDLPNGVVEIYESWKKK